MVLVVSAVLVLKERDAEGGKSVLQLVRRLRMTEHQKHLRQLVSDMADAHTEDDVRLSHNAFRCYHDRSYF